MVANTQSPFGFRAFGHQDGSAPTMGLQRLFMLSSDASVVGTGDLVVSSTASGFQGYVTQPSTSANGTLGWGLAGVFAGCEYYSPTVGRVIWSSYFPGNVSSSSPVTCWVISDPQMQFIAQASSASVLGTSNIGYNIAISSSLVGAANTTTGISGLTLASSLISALSSYPFRIVDTYQNFAPPGGGAVLNGTDSATAGQIMVVVPNTFQRSITTGVST
jgi:hypothetical protein